MDPTSFFQYINIPWIVWPIAGFVVAVIVCVFAGKEIAARKTYGCPSCGFRFIPKWYKLILTRNIVGAYYLKCPDCGKKDYFSKR